MPGGQGWITYPSVRMQACRSRCQYEAGANTQHGDDAAGAIICCSRDLWALDRHGVAQSFVHRMATWVPALTCRKLYGVLAQWWPELLDDEQPGLLALALDDGEDSDSCKAAPEAAPCICVSSQWQNDNNHALACVCEHCLGHNMPDLLDGPTNRSFFELA
jgi:hypothetical protein